MRADETPEGADAGGSTVRRKLAYTSKSGASNNDDASVKAAVATMGKSIAEAVPTTPKLSTTALPRFFRVAKLKRGKPNYASPLHRLKA